MIADLGFTFLGSRLKRIAERLQADAVKLHRAMGIEAQPAEMALLGAIDRYGPMTISAIVERLGVSQPAITRTAAGLVQRGALASRSEGTDQRHKTLRLTKQGRALVHKAQEQVWPAIHEALVSTCAPLAGSLLDQLAGLEAQLSERSLEARAQQLMAAHATPTSKRAALRIREYTDDLAQDFYDINAAWIESMFTLEDLDRQILENPRETIIDPGGFILFVESEAHGIIGTCALMKIEKGVYELTKTGVLERARGQNAGELLLKSVLERARSVPIKTLFLLTNAKCASAIHLYEKLGFRHDAQIMKRYGAEYQRCNVAMRYRG